MLTLSEQKKHSTEKFNKMNLALFVPDRHILQTRVNIRIALHRYDI